MNESSKLWGKLTEQEFSNIDDNFLKNFRSPGSSNKFVAWDPYEHSARYLKFLLFNVARAQSKNFFYNYKKLNSCFGNPINIRYAGCEINADYLAAIEEWEFLDKFGVFDGVDNVVEIGAGFGRTCHTIMTLSPSIKKYTIVDLEPMLKLSQSYLKHVLPDGFDKVEFISSNNLHAQEEIAPDLVINIDSFQEMPPSVISSYMDRIVKKSPKFYCKNPIGKYLPSIVGLPDLDPGQLMDVFKLGHCQNFIDIFNEEELELARIAFLQAYSPTPEYKVSATKIMDLFPYFHHALYVHVNSLNQQS